MTKKSIEPSAFEIRDQVTGKIYRIYKDGRAEGFGKKIAIINRIPLLCADSAR